MFIHVLLSFQVKCPTYSLPNMLRQTLFKNKHFKSNIRHNNTQTTYVSASAYTVRKPRPTPIHRYQENSLSSIGGVASSSSYHHLEPNSQKKRCSHVSSRSCNPSTHKPSSQLLAKRALAASQLRWWAKSSVGQRKTIRQLLRFLIEQLRPEASMY